MRISLNHISAIAMTIVLAWMALPSKGTHIYGGELLYTHNQGNNYTVTLTLYGDCSGQFFTSLINSRPSIHIFRDGVYYDSFVLVEDVSLRKEVSPVCPEDIDKTTCVSPTNTLPGVTRFVFSKNVDLPPAQEWQIDFAGYMGRTASGDSYAGRSRNITNIVTGNSGGQLLFLQAKLNNLNSHNSSPQYTSVPTPFYCLNVPHQYNQGAVDPDNDSLTFSLMDALDRNGNQVQYTNGFNGNAPLAIQAGSFSFSPISGQLSFRPNLLQHSVVVNRVEEYKNGVLVGSSMREMTFIVLDNCDNEAPFGVVDSTSIEGGLTRDNIVNVCVNTPVVKFTIPVKDQNNDNVTVKVNNLPDGATATVNNDGSTRPTIDFSWSTANVPLGYYNIFVNYTDDACPLSGSQTVAYSINVIHEIDVNITETKPTNCFNNAHIQLELMYGILPRLVTIIHENGTVVGNYIDSTGIIIDSFKTGRYSVTAESEVLKCKTETSFTIENKGTYPLAPEHRDIDACLGDPIEAIWVRPVRFAAVNWYSSEGKLPGKPTYSTNKPAVYEWYLSQTVDVCESIIDTVTVTVHDFPVITALNDAMQVCAGDTLNLTATGGVKYEWAPEELIFRKTDDGYYTSVRQPTTYIVTGYDPYGCPGNDTVTYNDIEQCCRFSYPTAFSPNRDGVNDGWRPVSYGNIDDYSLAVYDRWGKKIFESNNYDLKWDGSFNGKTCELGTYHYYLRAVCATGKTEVSKGSFILLR